MSRRLDVQAAVNGVFVLARDATKGVTIAYGNTVPAGSTKGYAPGCLFIQTDGAAATFWYRNDGTKASSTFNPAFGVDLTALTATAAELNSAISGILATAAELNRAADMDTRVVTHGPSDANTLALTAALHDSKTLYVTKTDGLAITLPAPVAGMRFRIVIGATIASASTIKSAAGTQLMIGHARMGNDSNNGTVDWPAVAASTFDTIDLLGTSNSTGGMEGQVITIEAMTTTRWFVEIAGDAAGTEATPFADTVA